jgi:mRNA interferase HigB
MNVVARRTLVEFWSRHLRAKGPLSAWHELARAAEWRTPQDVRDDFNSVDFVGDNRVIFDIGGNNYRLVVRISYPFKQVLVKFVGTHDDYDRIDPATV